MVGGSSWWKYVVGESRWWRQLVEEVVGGKKTQFFFLHVEVFPKMKMRKVKRGVPVPNATQ